MNGILGFMGLLKEPDLDDENKNQYIDIVNFSGRRLLNTVNDIVEISKIEAGQVRVDLSEVDVDETMEYLYKFFNKAASDKNLKLEMKNRLQNGKMIIKTDKKKLEGILINLLNNAIKFTEKGTVGFEVVAEDDQLLFSVYDTGIGIVKKQQKTVFDRFVQADLSYSRPYEGTGLGLSITKAYVEMLKGEIWLDSTYGKGTTFYFTIPYEPLKKKVLEEKEEEEILPPKKTSRIILVAEDDEVSITFLNHLLKKAGFQLLATTNGEDAVRTCREHPEISLILMDIKMPRMNGIEATRQIREFNKKVPIIAQTAYAMEGDSEKFLKAGCNAYISKPVAVQSLLTKINEFIDS
jgi:CheY-like chemotaxis protein